ncbi:hypothetical protein GCM10010230_23900 [Streptomyces narbonensis]|nr:hypothetical protein GCM10010230_23900 [Streptomyces narbonensis]
MPALSRTSGASLRTHGVFALFVTVSRKWRGVSPRSSWSSTAVVRPDASQSAYCVPFPPPVSPLSPDPVAVGVGVLLPVPESPVGAVVDGVLPPADAESEGAADDVPPPADAEPDGVAVGGAAWSSP